MGSDGWGMPGRPPTISDEEILERLLDADDPAFTTPEVGDLIGMNRSGAYQRLVELEDAGYVCSKTPGRTSIWWLSDSGKQLAREQK